MASLVAAPGTLPAPLAPRASPKRPLHVPLPPRWLSPLALLLLVCAATSARAALPVRPASAGVIRQSLLPNNAWGAKCLDGSPPGYYWTQGWGGGAKSWVIYLPGGAWCTTMQECADRASTRLGSSKPWPDPRDADYANKIAQATQRRNTFFKGILSESATQNPSFHNFNKVFIIYCDGGSFAGDRSNVRYNNSLSLQFNGKNILNAVFQDLKSSRGLQSAENVLLTGCSAGASAVSMACDSLRAKLPGAARVKCLMDAGFFMDVDDMQGVKSFRKQVNKMVDLHGMRAGFDSDCVKSVETKSLANCFFPEYNLFYVKTPMFIVNSVVDYSAIYLANQGNGSPGATQNAGDAVRCISSGALEIYATSALPRRTGPICIAAETAYLNAYQKHILRTINSVVDSKQGKNGFGSFLFSSVEHCTTIFPDWTKLQRKSISLVARLAQWYWN